jgi:hypothetical protein
MVIRRLGVWSVARLYGAILAVMGLLIGACFALAATIGGMAGAMRNSDSGFASGAWGALFGVGAIIILPLFYGVLGVVTGAIAAALYNLFAGMLGGIEIEMDTQP